MILAPLIIYLYATRNITDIQTAFRWWNVILIIWTGLLIIHFTVLNVKKFIKGL